MLTQRQKIAIRRHLGVPFAGTAQAGRLFGWRFLIHVEDLEYRMLNMQAPEESLLTGTSLGSFRIDGRPAVGNVLTFTVNDGTNNFTVAYTVTPSDLQGLNGSVTFSIANNVAAAFAANATAAAAGYFAVAVQPSDLFVAPTFPSYFAELQIIGNPGVPFTLTATTTVPTINVVDAQGTVSDVAANVTVSGVPTTVYGYIAIVNALAMNMTQAELSLQYESADVVTFRKDEVRARRRLYREYCEQLSKTMGGQEYMTMFGGGGGGATA